MATLLIGHHASVNMKAKNSLTPLHLCAQEDRVNVAAILVKNRAEISPQTKAGYTPLHVASHFGQLNMIRFLLQNGISLNIYLISYIRDSFHKFNEKVLMLLFIQLLSDYIRG
jgi:ankyrin